MANGILNIWGTQYGIPPGNFKDQVSIPYSDTIALVSLPATNTNIEVPVLTGCQGAIIIPGGGTSIRCTLTPTPTTYISPTYPTVIAFDPANFPTALYFTTVACTVDIRFF